MSQLCDFCGHANSHEVWCATLLHRAAATIAEALPIARAAAAAHPRSYVVDGEPFYPHGWTIEAIAAALVMRNHERNRAEEAEARSKAHSKNIAELTDRIADVTKQRDDLERDRMQGHGALKMGPLIANVPLARDAGALRTMYDAAIAERDKLRANLTYQDEREAVHSRTIAELTYARDGMFRELQALREATMLDPPENDWGKLTPAHVRNHVQDLADRVEQLTRAKAAAWDVQEVVERLEEQAKRAVDAIAERDKFAARCEIAERENERLTADVAQLRETTAADGEQVAYLSKERDFAQARCETWQREWEERETKIRDELTIPRLAKHLAKLSLADTQQLQADLAAERSESARLAVARDAAALAPNAMEAQAFRDVAKLLGCAAHPNNVIDTITRQLEELARLRSDRESVMVDLRKQIATATEGAGAARQALNAIGDMVPNREPGYPAIVAAVRVLVEDRDRLAREVEEMGEEMARDVEPEDVAAAAAELGACPRCEVEPLSKLEYCEHCGVCNTCANENDDGCDCADDDDDDDAAEPEWQSIAHRLFAAACPELAPMAKLGEEPDRWISEVTSARRVKEIAHKDNAKLVQQAKELAARLQERPPTIPRSASCPECGTPEGADHPLECPGPRGMVDGMKALRDLIADRVADRIAAKVIG